MYYIVLELLIGVGVVISSPEREGGWSNNTKVKKRKKRNKSDENHNLTNMN